MRPVCDLADPLLAPDGNSQDHFVATKKPIRIVPYGTFTIFVCMVFVVNILWGISLWFVAFIGEFSDEWHFVFGLFGCYVTFSSFAGASSDLVVVVFPL